MEAHLLGYCATKGPRPITELHRVLGQKKSTLTALVDRLERRKLVVRRLNPRDRRSWLIELTSRGSALAVKLHEKYRELESRLLTRMKPQDLAGFESAMAAIGEVTMVTVALP